MKTNYVIKNHLWLSLISTLLIAFILCSCSKPGDMETYDTYLNGTSWIWTKTISFSDNTMMFIREEHYPNDGTIFKMVFENKKFTISHNGNLIIKEKIKYCLRSESNINGWTTYDIKFYSGGDFRLRIKNDTLRSGLTPFPLKDCYGIHGNSFPCPYYTYFVKN